MFTVSMTQKLLGLLLACLGVSSLAANHAAGVDAPTAVSAVQWLAMAIGCLTGVGPSWKTYVNKVRPDTFAPDVAAATTATQLGDKETEVELYRCHQELVEAAERLNCEDAMMHFREGWTALFNEAHFTKVSKQGSPDQIKSPSAASSAKTGA